jgi:outer membrane protein TolC
MKFSRKFLFALFAVMSVQLVLAQDTRPITLKEAVELSIRNSKQLKISGARVEEASAALKEAQEKRLPDAKASGAYMWLSSANVNLKSSSSTNGSGSPKVSQALYGIVNASLPIYTGGRIRYGIESSRFLAEAAKLDAETDRDAVVMNTVEAYVNLYKAKAAVDLVNENLGQARQRVKELSSLEKNGVLARNDLLKAELQASNTELSLLEVENNWQLANINMNLMLGLPDKTVLQPDSSMINEVISLQPLETYVQSAEKNRKELESVGLKTQAAQSGVKATKGELYPSLALTGGYVAADIPKVLTITNAVNIGVGFSYNIGSLWKTKSKLQGAEAMVKQLTATRELLSDQVRLEVNRAYLNWLNSQKKIEVYQKAVEQASENYRIIKNKYHTRLATTTVLLDADVAHLQAGMNLLFSRADAVVVYNQLLQAAGMTGQSIK